MKLSAIHKLGIGVWLVVASFLGWMALTVDTIPLLDRVGMMAFVLLLPGVFVLVAKLTVRLSPRERSKDGEP
jgi:hypothetical protein